MRVVRPLVIFVAVFLSVIPFISTSIAQETGDRSSQLAEIDHLMADLADVQKLSKALDVCRRSLKKSPDQLDVQAKACRICWHLGVQLEDEDKAKETFEIGYKLAQKMKQRHPDKPDGWYWYAVNYGAYIERSSIFAKIGGVGEIMEHAKKTLSMDPRYDSGGAYLMVGRINQKMPGGNDAIAEDYFLKAIEVAPNRTTGHLYLGELYYDQKKYDQALKEIEFVLNSPSVAAFIVERKLNTPPATELKEEIQKKLERRRR